MEVWLGIKLFGYSLPPSVFSLFPLPLLEVAGNLEHSLDLQNLLLI